MLPDPVQRKSSNRGSLLKDLRYIGHARMHARQTRLTIADLLGLLQAGTVDTFADGNWFLSENRLDYFEYSFPLIAAQTVHVLREPDISTFQGTTLIFNVFTYRFYVAVVAIAVVALLISQLVLKRTEGANVRPCFSSRSHSGGNTTSSQGLLFSIRHRTLTLFLGYFFAIIVGLYQGRLLAQLLFPIISTPIDSVEKLTKEIASGRLTMLAPFTDWPYFEKINTSSLYEFRLVVHHIRRFNDSLLGRSVMLKVLQP